MLTEIAMSSALGGLLTKTMGKIPLNLPFRQRENMSPLPLILSHREKGERAAPRQMLQPATLASSMTNQLSISQSPHFVLDYRSQEI